MILIGRGLDLARETETSEKGLWKEKQETTEKVSRVKDRITACAVVRVQEDGSREAESAEARSPENHIRFPVVITKGSHLFPSRTQKYSIGKVSA